jgi:Fic family protein
MKKPEPPPSLYPFTDEMLNGFRDAMFKFYSSPELTKAFQEAEADHPSWGRFRFKVKGLDIDPKHLWRLAKSQRLASAQRIEIGSDRDFVFQYNLTHRILEALHQLDMNLGGSIAGGTTISDVTKGQLLISSLMEEAIASSLLEGAVTTREIAKQMLRSGRSPRNKSERMVINNYATMNLVRDRRNEPLSIEGILQIHRTVVKGTLDDPDNEGMTRRNDNVLVYDDATNEVVYVPPKYERIDGLLQHLCDFANDQSNTKFTHPVIKAIALHFLIGYIHPFVDGNGRTARALFYWYLLRSGYWMVEYLAISKIILRASAEYPRAYLHTEQDANDLTYFVDFNVRCLKMAMDDIRLYISRKLAERKDMFHFIKNTSLNERQTDLVALWLKEPERTMTIEEAKNRFGVVYQSARTDLLDLASLGLIESRRVSKKLVFFRKEDFEEKLRTLKRS